MTYAVIDTNVLVSAMITHNVDAPTVKVIEAIGEGRIIPLYNEEIIAEYIDVLRRAKFGFKLSSVARLIRTMMYKGLMAERVISDENFPDESDSVFYEVALSKEGSYLVTGNMKHFPKSPIVVSPTEMLKILEQEK